MASILNKNIFHFLYLARLSRFYGDRGSCKVAAVLARVAGGADRVSGRPVANSDVHCNK